MKVIFIVSALIGVALGAPVKLQDVWRHARDSYNYQPPEQPSGLYELPTTRPTTTTTTTIPTRPPPPPPPSGDYLPPEPSDTHIIRQTLPPLTPPPTSKQMGMGMLMPYDFGYGVDDPDSGNHFSHQETSDGQYVTGQYSVLLPDGRMQIVKFTSNPVDGYVAEVTYQ